MGAGLFSLLLLLVGASAISEQKAEPSSHSCGDGEYLYHDYCCKYCPAGTYVAKHCKIPHTEGVCGHCRNGEDYTAHANGLDGCMRCKLCKEDQVTVRACTSTSDTECQCKPGYFCPTQGCEMCYRCKSKCPKGKEIVQKCNATADLECDHPPKGTQNSAAWIAGTFIFVFLVAVGCFLVMKRISCNKTNRENKDAEKGVESENSTEILFAPEKNSNSNTPILEIQDSVQSPPVNSFDSTLKNEVPEDNCVVFSERSGLLLNGENNSWEGPSHRTTEYSAPVKPPDKTNFALHTAYSHMSNGGMPVSQLVRDSQARPHIEVKQLSQEGLSEILYYFIKEVPSCNWDRFMKTALTDNEIHKTMCDHPKNTEEQHYQMLIIWRNKFGNEASIIKLLDNLWDIGLRGPYENIVKYLISKNIITVLEAEGY